MILENMIRKEVKDMPPSGIRKFFDIVNEIFDENKRYTGSEVSEELYKLLRKSSFETFSEIDNNPFF